MPSNTTLSNGGCSSDEFRETFCHRPIHIAPEGHYQIGDAIESFPSPLVEFRRLAIARRQRIDFVIGTCEAQRKPFLPLTAKFRQAMR
jgi:hypothetical protein